MTAPQFLYFPLCSADPTSPTGCTSPDWHAHKDGRCRKPGKVPLGRWGELSAWRRERPEGNAAIRTGPETGLLVVDVDSPEAQRTYDSWGLPPTFTVRSGRPEGGHHYYFRWPDDLVAVPDELDGIEVKGAGRYVVGWDSVHLSGRRYEREGGQLVTLPEPFVARLRASALQREKSKAIDATPEAADLLERWIAQFPDAEEQSDGNWVMRCPAHNDHDPSLVATASGERLMLYCRGCKAPGELIAEAMDWQYGLRARPAPVLDPARLVDLGDRTPRERIEPGGIGTRFRLPALVAADLPDVRWAVPDMIPEGLTLLAGPPKLGKSWFVLDLAISVAGGRLFLDRATATGDVLYLALEDNAKRLKGRALTVLGGMPAPERLELWTRAGKLAGGLIPEIEEWLDAQPDPRLVVIDTLGRVQDNGTLDAKDGGYADAVEALAGLQALAAGRGVGVVVITHTKKGGWSANGDPLEAVLGSQGYAGTADSIMVLKRDRGEETGELFVTGREIEDETTLELTFSDETCRWTLGGELTTAQKIVRAIEADPGKRTKNWLAKNTKARKQDALAEINALEAAGTIVAAPPVGGGHARYVLRVG